MKHKFIISILIFLIPIGIAFVVLEHFAEPNEKQIKSEYTYQHLNQIEVLFLGPSTMSCAINPMFIDKPAANLAIPGNSIYQDILIFNHMQPKLPNLQTVVIDLSRGYLEDMKPKSNVYGSLLVHYNLVDAYKGSALSNLFVTTTNFKFSFNNLKQKLLSYQQEEFNQYGFITNMIEHPYSFKKLNYDTARINHSAHTKKIFKLHSQYSQDAYQYNQQLLQHLVAKCEENNINLIFLSPPKYGYYNQLKNNHGIRRDAFLKKVLSKENVRFYDFQNYNNQNTKLFYDIMHLNPQGAQEFSKKINNIIK